jgi:hypothetical protein
VRVQVRLKLLERKCELRIFTSCCKGDEVAIAPNAAETAAPGATRH